MNYHFDRQKALADLNKNYPYGAFLVEFPFGWAIATNETEFESFRGSCQKKGFFCFKDCTSIKREKSHVEDASVPSPVP